LRDTPNVPTIRCPPNIENARLPAGFRCFLGQVRQSACQVGKLIATLEIMQLTDDQKVQIFCAALSATIQAEAQVMAALGPNVGSKAGALGTVERASLVASEAIGKLMSKTWA